MKDEDKNLIKELAGIDSCLDHFKKHRRQGRIFFRGLICCLKIAVATFGITAGASFGLYSATVLLSKLSDIYNILLDILNSCI